MNSGSSATPPLIANLGVVALDQSTYVDPDDWSSQRTLSVAPIAAGSSVTQTWTVKPVLKGNVAVYVVVLPQPLALASAGPLAAPVSVAEVVRLRRRCALSPQGRQPLRNHVHRPVPPL